MRSLLLIALLPLSARTNAMPPARRPDPAGKQVNATQYPPTPKTRPTKTDTLPASPALIAAFHFIDSAFAKPTFEFEMLGPGMPAGLDSILFRFNNAVAANRQWFMEYRKQYPGQTLPYNDKFGITPDEYRRIQNYASSPTQMVPVDSQQVSVIRTDGLIRLKCSGDLRFLDYLYFDPKDMQAYYGGDTIPFTGRSGASSSPYGPWQGFKWRLEKTNVTITLQNVTAHVVEIDLGLPPAAGKLFVRILYQDLKADKTTSGIQLAGFLH